MNILKHNFDHLTEQEVETLQAYFSGFDYRSAGYTLLANYIWRETHCICWEVIGDYLFIGGGDCMTHDPKAIVSMPLTKTGSYESQSLRASIEKVRERFRQRRIPFMMELIPGHMRSFIQEAFPGEVNLIHDRDADEYVYLKDKLITLSGRALHKKKNHMNYFLKTYAYEVRSIEKNMREEILQLVKACSSKREYTDEERESLRLEEEAIGQLLDAPLSAGIYGVAIYIEGKLEAFAFGERLSRDTAVEHFEKANDSFRGLYQIVCSEFCKSLPEEILYVNREEDMGLEQLRQAKEALRPDHMAEKYTVDFCQKV